uniref:Arf-GAP domain-containing protein n=1 Tax=Macrostomum lignano TaxID=282301 RepID=A0A1I8FC65_9PLAT
MASAAFDCTVRAAHRSVLETCDPERYQLTQPVCQHLSAVDNGLRHMKLDNHFLDRSELWRQRVPCSEVAEHRERSTDALRRGEAFLQDYRAAMSKEFAETLTDGQSAANQSAALDGLRGFRREFDPNAMAAHNRVQRFCDWGSREPLRFDPQWRRGDADFPRLCHPKFVPETLANSGPRRSAGLLRDWPAADEGGAGGADDRVRGPLPVARLQEPAAPALEQKPKERLPIATDGVPVGIDSVLKLTFY